MLKSNYMQVLFYKNEATFTESHDATLTVMRYVLATRHGIATFHTSAGWAYMGRRAELRQHALRRLEFKMAQRGTPVITGHVFTD